MNLLVSLFCIAKPEPFADGTCLLRSFNLSQPSSNGDVFSALSVESSLQARSVTGGTARSRVVEAIEEAEKRMTIVD